MLCSLMPFALAANDIITLDKDVYQPGAVLMIYPQNAKLDQFKDYYNVRELDVSNTWKAAAPRETGIYEVRLYAQYPTYLTDLAAGLLAQTTFSVGGVTLPNQPVSGPGAAHPSTQ